MPIIRNQKTLQELNSNLDEQKIAMRAIWEIIKQKTGASDQELQETVAKINSSIASKLQPEPEVKPQQEVEEPVVESEEVPEDNETADSPVEEVVEPVVAEEIPEEVETVVAEEIVEEEVVEPVVVEDAPEDVVDPALDEEAAELAAKLQEREAVLASAVHVKIRGDRVKCPSCSKIFSVRDVRYWDGVKHTVCGTAMIVDGIEDLVF